MSCSKTNASLVGIALVVFGVMVAAQSAPLQLHIHGHLQSSARATNTIPRQATPLFNRPTTADQVPAIPSRQEAKADIVEDAKPSPLDSMKMPALITGVLILLGQAVQNIRQRLRSDEQAPLAAKALTAVTLVSLGSGAIADPAAAFTLPVGETQLYNFAWKAVKESFIDQSFNGQNWEKVRDDTFANPPKTREETYVAIRSSLDSLGDPFTRLLEPPQYDNIKRRLNGKLTGVGLEIVPIFDDAGNKMKVVDRTLDGPADKAGIKDFDLILAINGEPIGSQSQWIVANKLVGDRNTQVTITVQTPGEEPRDVQITR
eukprot:EG_transcript_20496